MFYYTEEGWKPFKHKVSYPMTVISYDNDLAPYDQFVDVDVEDITLTDEQHRRLETIRHVSAMGIKDIEAYVFEGAIEDPELVVLKEEIKAEDTRQKLAKLIRWDELTTAEMVDLVDDFKDYKVGVFYVKDDIFSYNDQLYKVISETGHTSQLDWEPDKVPALYLPIAPPATEEVEVVPDWKQPLGGHDSYSIGDKVMFKGVMYSSKINANSWSPETYAAGWLAL